MSSLTASDLKCMLGLEPHPREGGWFRQTYASAERVAPSGFTDGRYPGPRRMHTAIYYLLEPDTFSEMHRLRSDEVFHHYAGCAVEMLQLYAPVRSGEAGEAAQSKCSERFVLGADLLAGQCPQLLVPRGVWQGSRLLPAELARPETPRWALLGCTVSPGFEYEDYETGSRAELQDQWPEQAELLAALTHSER